MLALTVAGFACILGSASAAGPPAKAGVASPEFRGLDIMNVGPLPLHEADYSIAQAHKANANVVKTEVPWSMMEPNGPGRVDPASQAFLDRLTADANADGIKVILGVDSSPCWASGAPASLLKGCRPGKMTRANGWPPSDAQAYATYVASLAQRYGTELAGIEIWNEPDQINEKYFAGPQKPARYAALLRTAYTAIKAANPSVNVLAGSIVGSNGKFLRALYAAGIKGYYDGLSVHFYTLTLGALRSIREVQTANGDDKPLWLDEFGWSSCWPKAKKEQEQGCVTASVQAANIKTFFSEVASAPYVGAAVIYQLQSSRQEEFGILAPNGSEKPSFRALASVLGSPAAVVPEPTLALHRKGNRLVASGSGPVGDFMSLQAFQGHVLRYRAILVLDRFNRFSVVLPAALGTKGLTVRVYQYWAGSGRAAQRSA